MTWLGSLVQSKQVTYSNLVNGLVEPSLVIWSCIMGSERQLALLYLVSRLR